MEIKTLQLNFLNASRSRIRAIHKSNQIPCTKNSLLGIPHPFFYFDNVIVFSSEYLSEDIFSQDIKYLKHYCKAMNYLREKIAGLDVSIKIIVPICAYVKYNGISYAALGGDNISLENIEHSVFTQGGKIESKNKELNDLINLISKNNQSTNQVLENFDISILPSSITIHKIAQDNFLIFLKDIPFVQLKPGLYARKSYILSRAKKYYRML